MKTLALIIHLAFLLSLSISAQAEDPQCAQLAMFEAAQRGCPDRIEQLVKSGIDVNAPNEKAETPLHIAISYFKLDAVKVLLKLKADINRQTSYGVTSIMILLDAYQCKNNYPLCREIATELFKYKPRLNGLPQEKSTALHLAAELNDDWFTAELLKAGALVNVLDQNGSSALTISILYKNFEVSKVLLAAKADPNAGDGFKPIHAAAQVNSAETIVLLFNKGADLKSLGKLYYGVKGPALTLAARENSTAAMQKLIELGVDINQYSSQNMPPLYYAIQENKVEASLLLVGKNAEVHLPENADYVRRAIEHNMPSVVSVLLDKKAELPEFYYEGGTQPVLFYAVIRDLPDLALKMLQSGAKLNSLNKDNESALFYAKSRVMAQFLITQGINIEIETLSGLTALLYLQDLDILELLLKNGANFKRLNKYGQSALFYNQTAERLSLFIKYGCSVNTIDSYGKSALFYSRDLASVKVLLAAGADARLIAKDKTNVLFNSDLPFEAIELLIENGANVNQQTAELCHFTTIRYNYAVPPADLNTLLRLGMNPNMLVKDCSAYGDRIPGPLPYLFFTFIRTEKLDSLKWLVQFGANPKAVDAQNRNILYYAETNLGLSRPMEEQLRFLISKGANPNHQDVNKDTPLTYAFGKKGGYSKDSVTPRMVLLTHVLPRYGADINRGPANFTPLLLQALKLKSQNQNDRYYLVRDLLWYGNANPNIHDEKGWSALHLALKYSGYAPDYKMIESLLQKGADVNEANPDGKTPLQIAIENKDELLQELLIQNGAKTIPIALPVF